MPRVSRLPPKNKSQIPNRKHFPKSTGTCLKHTLIRNQLNNELKITTLSQLQPFRTWVKWLSEKWPWDYLLQKSKHLVILK
jgi:hypothetical protein